MESSLILGITTFIYMASTVCYVGYAVFRKDIIAKAGIVALVFAILANTTGIAL